MARQTSVSVMTAGIELMADAKPPNGYVRGFYWTEVLQTRAMGSWTLIMDTWAHSILLNRSDIEGAIGFDRGQVYFFNGVIAVVL